MRKLFEDPDADDDEDEQTGDVPQAFVGAGPSKTAERVASRKPRGVRKRREVKSPTRC